MKTKILITNQQYLSLKTELDKLFGLLKELCEDEKFRQVFASANSGEGKLNDDEESVMNVLRLIAGKDVLYCYEELGHPIEIETATAEGQLLMMITTYMLKQQEGIIPKYKELCGWIDGSDLTGLFMPDILTQVIGLLTGDSVNIRTKDGREYFGIGIILYGLDKDMWRTFRRIMYNIASQIANADGKVTDEEARRLAELMRKTDDQTSQVTTERQIDISPRKRQLQEEYERLQQEYSEYVGRREDMLNDEKPRLEAMYMESIGQLLYEELSLQYDIALLKQKRDYLQAYANRGEKPDEEAVEEQVKEAAQTYNDNLRQEEERIKEARAFLESHTEKDSQQQLKDYMDMKRLYRKMVHRLHPDLHPEQTEWERELFLKVQKAYDEEDLEQLRQLEQELDAGMPSTSIENDTIEEWEERVAKLKEQISAVKEEIKQMENGFPFTYRQKLYDMEWISAQKEEIRVRIEILEKERDRLQKIVDILLKG